MKRERFSDENILIYQQYYNTSRNLTKTAENFNVSRRQLRKYLVKPWYKGKHEESYYRRAKIEAVEYKGGKCQICGYNKSSWALDFHHKDPKEKEFKISGGNKSFASIKEELDKCDLLCKNCHAEEHERIFKNKQNDKKQRLPHTVTV